MRAKPKRLPRRQKPRPTRPLSWRCGDCGYLDASEHGTANCPNCGGSNWDNDKGIK